MITKYSLKKPMTIFVAVIITLLLGAVAFKNIKTDFLPNMEMPYVVVMTACHGFPPEKVETMVTKPLESSLSMVSGVDSITSQSAENMSMLVIEFSNRTNMDTAMIELNNRLATVSSSFDKEIGSPFMIQIDPDMLPVYVASVSKKGADFQELTRISEDIIVPALERTDGVASVVPLGAILNKVEITLNQKKIDSVNEKIAAAFDQKTASALKEIDDGKSALSKAQSELQERKNSASLKMAQAGIALTDAKSSILTAIGAMESAEAQTSQILKLLGQIFPKIASWVDPEKIGEEADKASVAILNLSDSLKKGSIFLENVSSQLENADPGKIDWESLEAMVKEDPDSLGRIEGARQYLSGVLGPDGSLPRQIKNLASKMKRNSDSLGSFSADLAGTNPKSSWKKLADDLTGFQRTASQSKDSLPAQKNMLQQKLQQLNEQQIKVEQGKIILATELASAQQKIQSSKDQLDAGEAKLKESLDKAASNAGLESLLDQKILASMISAQNFSMPAGYLEEGENKFLVKVGNPLNGRQELEKLPLFVSDDEQVGTIMLSDVADIDVKDNSEQRFAKVNGVDGILVSLQKQSLSSTNIVSKSVRQKIRELEKENPGLKINSMMDQGVYIDVVIKSVIESLIAGSILAALILFVFLRSIKATLVVTFSIPISLMLAIVLMYFSGVSVNLISMSGLALGVGMLVDNSIVVIENTYRLRSMGIPAGKAALKGARQMAGAITASTLTTICVFLPIVFTKGISRQLFADMGLTIGYSLLASLFVALSLVPVLSATMLRGETQKRKEKPPRIKDIYEKMLGFCLNKKWIPIGFSLVLLAVSAYGATRLGTAFIPESAADQMLMTISLPEEEKASDEKLHDRALAVTKALLELKDVDAIGVYDSPSGIGMSPGPKKSLTVYIVLKEKKTKSIKKVTEDIKKKADGVPGCKTVLSQGSNMITAFLKKGLVIKIRGEKMETLKELAKSAAALLKTTAGLQNIDDGFGDTLPEIQIAVDKEKAVEHQLTVAQVCLQVAQGIQNSVAVTSLDKGDEGIEVLLRKAEDKQLTYESLKDYPLTYKDRMTGQTKTALLGDISDISLSENLSSIAREDLKRVVTVKADVKDGYNIGLISRKLKNELQKIDLPMGYSIKIEGENKMINSTLHDVGMMLLLAIILIYLIMVAEFQSLSGPFVVMFTIPLAFTGGLFALWIFGLDLSAISVLGFLILAGVVVNNAIVFVDTSNQLQRSGMERRKALIETGKMRMRPIFMTAVTTVLGLTALVLGIGSGAEMLQPLAIVVVFGLSYATLLTLFVVPALCDGIFMRKPMKNIKIEQDAD